jgi:cell division protease FtsH
MEKWPKGTEKRPWRIGTWILILGGLLVIVAVHSLLVARPRETLDYGQFINELTQGRILTAKLSDYEIEGKWLKAGEETPYLTSRGGTQGHDKLFDLLQTHCPNWSAGSEPSGFQSMMLYLLPSAVLVGVLIYAMRRLGGGSAMAFARSRARLYGQEDIEVTFKDVAGIDEAVDELREVVEFLRTPEKYQALGGRIPKGVLLVGPPGTGKTLLARAVAGEAGVPFFCLSGSDFVEMFVGVGAARVRDLFQQAQQKAPCIIFIDELDALGKTRTSLVGSHDEREQTLNQLLVEMDGFDSDRGVIIMSATNRAETLDPALLRPGRFDRHVLVDRPDINGREAILRVHVRNVKLAAEVDLRSIAGLTPGFVGADLANLVNEAALLAARAGHTEVTRASLENGVERVVAGLEKKRRAMLPQEKHRIAVHEAGHAIVAALLPNTDPVHKVSILPRGLGALGYTLQRPEDDRYLATHSELAARIQVLLAGTVAEELVLGEASSGAQNDLERATNIARHMVTSFGMSPRIGRVCFQHAPSPFLSNSSLVPPEREHSEQTAREIDEEVRRIVDEAAAQARALLEAQRTALDKLVDRLNEKEVIDQAELHGILGLPQRPTAPVLHA